MPKAQFTVFKDGVFKNARTAWVVSDGTKGMEVQSLGLATRMGLDVKIIRLNLPRLLRAFPRLGKYPFMPIPPSCRRHIKLGWPDVIITTGRRMAGLSILLKQKSKGRSRTIHIQDAKLPSLMFDVMIVPSHDKLRGENVLVTTGSLNALTPEIIKKSGEDLPLKDMFLNNGQKPIIAVMVGGSNRRYGVAEPELLRLGQITAALGHATGGSLVFIPSRRTRDMASPSIEAGINNDLLNPPPYWIWDGVSINPYPGILSHADAVIVTSDSVNMSCEACLSGKPVYRYDFKEEQGRIGLFHRIMTEAGYTSPLEPINVSDFPKKPPPHLDETGRIAKLLLGGV